MRRKAGGLQEIFDFGEEFVLHTATIHAIACGSIHVITCATAAGGGDNLPDMKEAWFERFLEAVQADPRGMRRISLDANCGVNYVQQLVKDRKEPTIGRFVRVLDVLGPATTMYVITGLDVKPEDEAFLRQVLAMTPETRRQFSAFLDSLEAPARMPEPQGGPQH